MEPKNDPELSSLLREWRAPEIPASLENRVLRRGSWWRFLLLGSIRVPMPVVCGVAILMILAGWRLAAPGGAVGRCFAENARESAAYRTGSMFAPKKSLAAEPETSVAACATGSHC